MFIIKNILLYINKLREKQKIKPETHNYLTQKIKLGTGYPCNVLTWKLHEVEEARLFKFSDNLLNELLLATKPQKIKHLLLLFRVLLREHAFMTRKTKAELEKFAFHFYGQNAQNASYKTIKKCIDAHPHERDDFIDELIQKNRGVTYNFNPTERAKLIHDAKKRQKEYPLDLNPTVVHSNASTKNNSDKQIKDIDKQEEAAKKRPSDELQQLAQKKTCTRNEHKSHKRNPSAPAESYLENLKRLCI